MFHPLILDKISSVLEHTNEEFTTILANELAEYERIFIAGAGRSNLVARFFAMRLMHMGYDVSVVGDTTTPKITNKDLLVCISGSGSTKSLINYAKTAKEHDAMVAAITANIDSELAGISDTRIIIGNDNTNLPVVRIMPMGTVFELSTLIFLESVVAYLMNTKGISEADMKRRHTVLE